MLKTDIKTGITYTHYLIRKDKTIGEIKTINKKDVEPTCNMHKNNYYKREDDYTNVYYWSFQRDNMADMCKK